VPIILILSLAAVYIYYLLVVLLSGYRYDYNSGEPFVSHPLLTLLELFVLWIIAAIGSTYILRTCSPLKNVVCNNHDLHEEKATNNLPFGIVAYVCIYFGYCFTTIEITKSVVKHLEFSSSTGHQFVQRPVLLQFEYLAIFVVFVTPLILIYQLQRKKPQNVPSIVSILTSVLNSCGFHSILTWTCISTAMMFPSLNVIAIWFVFLSLSTFMAWCYHRMQLNVGYCDHLQSFFNYLLNLCTFLTRLAQVILVFLPFDDFNLLEAHVMYIILLTCFGNRDAYLGACAAKTHFWSRCGCGSSEQAAESSPKLTWCQYLSGCFFNILYFMLALYRTVWVIMLVIPGLHSLAMSNSPGRLTLRILSIWNLISFLYIFAKSYFPAVEEASSSSSNSYRLLEDARDVEMCAPAAVVVHEKVEKDGGVAGVVSN